MGCIPLERNNERDMYSIWNLTFLINHLQVFVFQLISVIMPSKPVSVVVSPSLSRIEYDLGSTTEKEDSPFPEVRASVSNIDDPDMPAMTIRMWFVGLVLCLASRWDISA